MEEDIVGLRYGKLVVESRVEWSTYLGIPYKTLHRRIVGLGWKIERAFNQPLRKSPKYHDLSNKKDGQKPNLR